jgi:hypothetical protein
MNDDAQEPATKVRIGSSVIAILSLLISLAAAAFSYSQVTEMRRARLIPLSTALFEKRLDILSEVKRLNDQIGEAQHELEVAAKSEHRCRAFDICADQPLPEMTAQRVAANERYDTIARQLDIVLNDVSTFYGHQLALAAIDARKNVWKFPFCARLEGTTDPRFEKECADLNEIDPNQDIARVLGDLQVSLRLDRFEIDD